MNASAVVGWNETKTSTGLARCCPISSPVASSIFPLADMVSKGEEITPSFIFSVQTSPCLAGRIRNKEHILDTVATHQASVLVQQKTPTKNLASVDDWGVSDVSPESTIRFLDSRLGNLVTTYRPEVVTSHIDYPPPRRRNEEKRVPILNL